MKKEFLILGNGAASIKAIEGIRQTDKDSVITVLAKEKYPAYSPLLTTYIISGELEEKDAFYRTAEWYKNFNVNLRTLTKAVRVDPREHKVYSDNGESFRYDKLLAATGASPHVPDLPGKDLKGVHTLRTLKDAGEIKNRLGKTKTAVVIGGGLVSCKAAEALYKKGINLHMVISSSRLLSKYLSSEPSEFIRRQAEERGIVFHLDTDVTEIAGKDEVEGVRLRDGSFIRCGLVLIGKGVRPNTEMFSSSGVKISSGILVDNYLATSDPDIFAAGDAAEAPNYLTGKNELSAIWPAAVEQGRIAGLNMTGKKVPYQGILSRNVVSLFGITLVSAGINRISPGEHQVIVSRGAKRDSYRQIILNSDSRIVGALLLGDPDGIGKILSLMIKGTEVKNSSKLLYPKYLDTTSAFNR